MQQSTIIHQSGSEKWWIESKSPGSKVNINLFHHHWGEYFFRYILHNYQKKIFFVQYTKKWLEIELLMHYFGTEGNITRYSYQNLPISTLWKHLSIVWYKLIIVIFHELFMKKTLNKNSCLSVLWCEQGHTKP